jgi:hypothetical protein
MEEIKREKAREERGNILFKREIKKAKKGGIKLGSKREGPRQTNERTNHLIYIMRTSVRSCHSMRFVLSSSKGRVSRLPI